MSLLEKSRNQGAMVLGMLGNVIAPNVMAAQRWLAELRTHRSPVRLDVEPSAAYSDILRWSRFGRAPDAPSLFARIDAGIMRGRRDSKFEVVQCPALAGLIQTSTAEATVDIQRIDGLCASKSDLHAFASLDEMAQVRCEGLLRERTHAQLDKLMAHRESRIFHGAGDTFYQQAWNPRVVLMNDGGSHHFVAARHLAGQLVEEVMVTASATVEVFAVPKSLLDGPVHEAAMATGGAYYTRQLPPPLAADVVFFLPKHDPRSMRIAEALRAGGATDVSAHLAPRLSVQQAHEHEPGALLDDPARPALRP